MNKIKFAALAAALLLQSLVYAGSASFAAVSVSGHLASGSFDSARPTVSHAETRWDNSLILDDVQGQPCDPEDDCPRPTSLPTT